MTRIALLGFLPWVDAAREVSVVINPAERAARACADLLVRDGHDAVFVPVPVSGDGIDAALARVRELAASVVVALGRTSTGPRVERWGRVAGAWRPGLGDEEAPWLLAPDATALAAHLATLVEPGANTEPFAASDDAGAYYCDHLCVELVRDARRRGTRSRFLHVTGVDDCPPEQREARLRQYARQARATVDWLLGTAPAA